ncbi:MAG: threonylcarbamoyl-AMP synthase [Nitrospirae bacterium]|nr:threonylcarbamoyl-AMP synthase [Nitrospirota bacterium]
MGGFPSGMVSSFHMTFHWKIDLKSPDPAVLQKTADLLRKDGIIAYPTETYYALGANPFSAPAVRKIFRIKERMEQKPLLVLISRREEMTGMVSDLLPVAERLARSFWPGPLTILFRAASVIPGELTAGTGKIGIRLPSSPDVRGLLQGIGMPLTGTSANISGRPSIRDPRDLLNIFEGKIDVLLDGGTTPGGLPSTVVDATIDPPVIEREGRISASEIRHLLGLA